MAPRVAATIRQGLDVRWVRISLYREGDPSLTLARVGAPLEAVGADGVELGAEAAPTATAPLCTALSASDGSTAV
ncbi:MAG: hypothetical protein ACR2JC_09885 [Chloroflexota bacterium]|nr:MAG: hypothetical protein DLM70_12530 [Chloroflexota bacterium]